VRGRVLGTVLPVEVNEAELTACAEANAAPAEAIRQGQLEERALKSSTTGQPVTYTFSSPTYFDHLWQDYKQAWKAEYGEDGVTPVSKSEIRRLTFALQRSRCY
jgi:hypothetical protein